jgi:hypothetical protein
MTISNTEFKVDNFEKFGPKINFSKSSYNSVVLFYHRDHKRMRLKDYAYDAHSKNARYLAEMFHRRNNVRYTSYSLRIWMAFFDSDFQPAIPDKLPKVNFSQSAFLSGTIRQVRHNQYLRLKDYAFDYYISIGNSHYVIFHKKNNVNYTSQSLRD